MPSPTYRNRQKQRRLERSRKGVAARLANKSAASAGQPIREWVRWRVITDESIHRTRTVLEFWTCRDERGRTHNRVLCNGVDTCFRSWASAIRCLSKTL